MALIIPNVIANGDVEDADVVMENFDYIAGNAPSGPGTTIVNNVPTWGDVTGTGLTDSGVPIAEVVRGGGTTAVNNIAMWNNTTGTELSDSGITVSSVNDAISDLVDVVHGGGTTAVNNIMAWSDTAGLSATDAGISISDLTDLVKGGGTTVVNNVAMWSDTAGTELIDSGIAISTLAPRAATEKTPPDPTATTSMVGVMMGLAGTITPTRSGTVMVTMTMALQVGGAETGFVQLRYGTGSAPVNGQALMGTTASPIAIISSEASPFPVPLVALITGLTIGVAVWLDVSLTSSGGGSVSVSKSHVVALEA